MRAEKRKGKLDERGRVPIQGGDSLGGGIPCAQPRSQAEGKAADCPAVTIQELGTTTAELNPREFAGLILLIIIIRGRRATLVSGPTARTPPGYVRET